MKIIVESKCRLYLPFFSGLECPKEEGQKAGRMADKWQAGRKWEKWQAGRATEGNSMIYCHTE